MRLRNFLKTSVCFADDGGAALQTAVADTGGAVSWTTGLDAEVVGHVQARGWDKLDPAAAAREAAKSHREANQKMTEHLGAPADQFVRVPKDATDEAGWKAFYSRLGVPNDPTEYKFDAVKVKVGDAEAPLPQNYADFARATAAALHLNAEQAAALASNVHKFNTDATAADANERGAKIASDRAALDKDWGAAKEANLFIAKQAAAKLGFTPEAVAALENASGYKDVMNALLKVGQSIGEDKFIANTNPAIPGVMSREQAVARKAELMHDTVWAKAYLDGDSAKGREMAALNLLIVGEDDTDRSRA